MKESRREYTGKGRQKWEYQCSVCSNWFPQKNIEIDHIVECGSIRKWEDLTPFAQRLFCGKEGLRVVCKQCHKEITKNQRFKKKNE